MRILVDEMPKEPYRCPYSKADSTMDYEKYTCTYKEEFGCHSTFCCPYFIDFKTCFENEIQEYDVRKHDYYEYG